MGQNSRGNGERRKEDRRSADPAPPADKAERRLEERRGDDRRKSAE